MRTRRSVLVQQSYQTQCRSSCRLTWADGDVRGPGSSPSSSCTLGGPIPCNKRAPCPLTSLNGAVTGPLPVTCTVFRQRPLNPAANSGIPLTSPPKDDGELSELRRHLEPPLLMILVSCVLKSKIRSLLSLKNSYNYLYAVSTLHSHSKLTNSC